MKMLVKVTLKGHLRTFADFFSFNINVQSQLRPCTFDLLQPQEMCISFSIIKQSEWFLDFLGSQLFLSDGLLENVKEKRVSNT